MGVSHTMSAETELTYQRRRAGFGGEIWNSCSHTLHAARRSDDADVASASTVTMKRWWPP